MVMLSPGYNRTVTQQVHRPLLTFNLSKFVRVESKTKHFAKQGVLVTLQVSPKSLVM